MSKKKTWDELWAELQSLKAEFYAIKNDEPLIRSNVDKT